MLKWLLAAVILYGGFVALLYVAQRFVQYFPERRRTAPWAAGLPEAEEAVLDTADGKRVIVWHVPPREGHPIFLYFHGNGGSLRWRAERFRSLTADADWWPSATAAMAAPHRDRPHRGRRGGLRLCHRALSRRAHRPVGRIARLRGRAGTGSGKAGRARRTRGPFHFGRRHRRTALLVPAGAALHEGPVSLGFARQQGHGTR
jgi:hypothetical protein